MAFIRKTSELSIDSKSSLEKIVRLLCKDYEFAKRSADINFQDKDGNTLLHLAASLRDPYAVDTLLELGANSFLKNNRGQYPLNCAVMQAVWDTYVTWEEGEEMTKKITKTELSRAVTVVESLIIKGGNDPYKIYESQAFHDKSAISDCPDFHVTEAMKNANIKRLMIINDKNSPLAQAFAIHQAAEEKLNKDAFVGKMQKYKDELSNDAKIKPNVSVTVYDPSKLLAQQVKKIKGYTAPFNLVGIPFFIGEASFEPIKVAHRYIKLSAAMHSGFDKDDDYKIHLTRRYLFTIKDYTTDKTLIDNVSEKDIESTMKSVQEYLLDLKKEPMPSLSKERLTL